jgi:ATP-binding cassette subfamily F protein 3
MPIINLNDIHLSFGEEIVLDGLTMRLFPGEKVGMVGPNGCGKTTLFRLILGKIEPDMGEIKKRGKVEIGYLPQEPVFCGNLTVMQEMHAGLEDIFNLQTKMEAIATDMESLTGDELETAMLDYDRLNTDFELQGGYEYQTKINMILAGLKLDMALYHENVSALSGGQLSRLGLAKVLLRNSDLLLLDEPTNHLDLEAVVWLEKFLKNYKGGVLIISHDRYLLDSVAEKIIEIQGGNSTTWKGNYTKYRESKEIALLDQNRQLKKKTKMVDETLDFIARNRNLKGMQGTARGRATRLEKVLKDEDYLKKQAKQKTINFQFQKSTSQSNIVMKCMGLCKSYGDLTLFKDLTFELNSGDKLGLTGPNGTGKSTFLKLAMGLEKSSDGVLKMGQFLSVGYLDQHGEELNPANSVLDEAKNVRPDLSTEEVRSKLGAFLFSGDDVFKKCGSISGGQQNRLMLCKLVLAEPDVLILDEPTNHLDIPSKEMLERALKAFNGAVIVVSHDRFFLDRVANKLLMVGVDEFGKRQPGKCEMVEGVENTYSRYAETLTQRIATAEEERVKAEKKKAAQNPDISKNAAPAGLKKFNKYAVEEIENMIMEQEEKIDEFQLEFGDERVYLDPDLLSALKEKIEKHKNKLNLLYQAYEYRS